ICAAFQGSFGISPVYLGLFLTGMTLLIIFGGVQRIAKVSGLVVPLMAIGYIILAVSIVLLNITELPGILRLIVTNAFGGQQAFGGVMGAALIQGIKRGLFSNEAGMGSAPNAAATAHVSHPVKQGLVQALGVFTDTLVICTCTDFIILFSGIDLEGGLNGVQLTQAALIHEVGSTGGIYVSIAILLFAFSSILGNYYYGECNIRFITQKKWVLNVFRLLVGGMVMFGSLVSLQLVWDLADICMGLMALCNLIAIILLGDKAFKLLKNYSLQKRKGIKSPIYQKSELFADDEGIDCW
ncbi:MAG: alanine:cation symporter family protein, partial [Massilibacteroides sp.]|nr:alanine:cation symporter family protein [Massilibacteroides sp.]